MITITKEHIAILSRLTEYLETNYRHGTVPEFDAKRPFGTSGHSRIAAETAGIAAAARGESWDESSFDYDDEESVGKHLSLLRECTPVLKAILRNASFEDVIGMQIDEEGNPTT